ncbi:hypothetical protein UPYG_G00026220 [Umbra pygmaea]|uniref:Uncharacterized protein n=1 Tax=Umbra pygmaea TaxID=75934 RepID=A0ABD0Y5T9_UMBPY
MNARLLKDLEQMALFKHTGELEVFHNVSSNTVQKDCTLNMRQCKHEPCWQSWTITKTTTHNKNRQKQRLASRDTMWFSKDNPNNGLPDLCTREPHRLSGTT